MTQRKELMDKKMRLVEAFNNEIAKQYNIRLDSIDYKHFRVFDNG